MKSISPEKISAPLLLHVCCADCAEHFLGHLSPDKPLQPHITFYFDNSNIHPRTEYIARLKALQEVSGKLGIPLIVADWSPKHWFEEVGDWKKCGPAERCKRCWRFRLERTAEKSRELKFSSFSTTMLTSEYMNTRAIENIGEELKGEDLQFVSLEKKCEEKGQGKNVIPRQALKSSYYRQNYCGCVYSLKERYEEKFARPSKDIDV